MNLIDMLHEPIKSPIRTIDLAKHQKISDDIAAFIKRGREIIQIPIGISGEIQVPIIKQMDAKRIKNSKKKPAKAG